MKKERDSGVELLRVFAMLLVIGVHAFSYGGFYGEAAAVGGHVAAAALFMKLATRAAVPIFVVITGCFMVHAPFDLKKNLRRVGGIYQKMLFYSVTLTAVFLPLGAARWVDRGEALTLGQVILKGLMPVTSQTWYFLTDYLLLCLLIPFVNLALQKLTGRQYAGLALGLAALMSLWLTLLELRPFNLVLEPFGYEHLYTGKQVFHFLYFYILGGWVGRFAPKREKPNPLWLFGALGTVLVNYLLYTRLPPACGFQSVAGDYCNPLLLLNALFLLLFFRDLHFKSKIVNALGGATLGVYALTEFRFLRTLLWRTVSFKRMDNSNLWLNFVHVAAVLCGVFLAAAAVDLLVSRLLSLLRGAVQKRKLKKVEQSS